MKNHYEIRGEDAVIFLRKLGTGEWVECYVDAKWLREILLSIPTTWYAQPAKGSTTKHYAMAKLWNNHARKMRTLLMHRVLAFTCPEGYEVHHEDNDGLNNRIRNLRYLTHLQNIRASTLISQRTDWASYDKRHEIAELYRSERLIAAMIQRSAGLTRQALWKIRTGRSYSPAAREYRAACDKARIPTLEQLQLMLPRIGSQWGALYSNRGTPPIPIQ